MKKDDDHDADDDVDDEDDDDAEDDADNIGTRIRILSMPATCSGDSNFLFCILGPWLPSGYSVLSESPGTIDGLHVLESSGNSRFCLCSTTFQSMSFPTEGSTRAQSLFEILAK